MARIRYFDGHKFVEVEVSEKFATEYAEMERKENLVNRKETRRHQSLDKSLERGWDVKDLSADVESIAEQRYEKSRLRAAVKNLTNKQRIILILHVEYKKSFREIGEKLGIHKDTVKEHYHAAIKKMKKFYD